MKFEEALIKFKISLHEQFGVGDGVVKIALEPELFDRVVQELFFEGGHYRFRMSDCGELNVHGVQLLARKRDTF